MRSGILWICGSFALVALTALGVHADEKKTKSKAKAKHAPLHHALYELHDARHELKASKFDFGENRNMAVLAINDAIKHIDLALIAKGDNLKPSPTKRDLAEHHKKYKHHPHLHHAVHELHHAHKHLKDAKHDFGGHRENALRDVDIAIREINALLKSHKE